ncbi:26S proteasome regulatory subunit N3 [Nematocida sp. AWRm77]|nr:26S proteasome regulatory subunit N3 [Nematocida sp. AWRm77]
MERIEESIQSVEKNTLKGTKDALKHLFDISAEVPSAHLEGLLDMQSSSLSRHLLQLFLGWAYVKEGAHKSALKVARTALGEVGKINPRALDGVVAGLWSVLRVSSTALGENPLPEYLVGLAANREYQNVESTTVLINSILMYLRQEEMYDEAYTFLKHTKLPENAEVGHSSVFYYLAGIVYLMAGEYGTAEKMVNLAIVKSTDEFFTTECRKVHVLACMHQGKHPHRKFFEENAGLEMYQKLLLSIKSCSLSMFYKALEEGKESLKKDGMYQAVIRLEAAVQKEHVRRIGMVYTRISLEAVGSMLGVSGESAVFLLQKAINEGIISGHISMKTQEYISVEKRTEAREGLRIEEMLSIANTLTMLKKHEPIKRKTLEEMQAEMIYNEYQI